MDSIAQRACSRCLRILPLDAYYLHKKGYRSGRCKVCHANSARERYNRRVGKVYGDPRRLPDLPFQDSKLCVTCGEVKPRSGFYVDTRSRSQRLYERCRACRSKSSKENRPWLREGLRATAQAWYLAHKDLRNAQSRARRHQQGERYRQRQRAEYQKSKGRKQGYSRLWYAANADQARAYAREYARTHPVENRLAAQRRRARLSHALGTIFPSQWRALKRYYGYQCLRCGACEPAITLTLDHVVPLSQGGPHLIGNCQPLCRPCNSAKHVKSTDYRPSQ